MHRMCLLILLGFGEPMLKSMGALHLALFRIFRYWLVGGSVKPLPCFCLDTWFICLSCLNQHLLVSSLPVQFSGSFLRKIRVSFMLAPEMQRTKCPFFSPRSEVLCYSTLGLNIRAAEPTAGTAAQQPVQSSVCKTILVHLTVTKPVPQPYKKHLYPLNSRTSSVS